LRHQSELQAAPAAVLKLVALALCIPVAAQFGERSCAVPVVAEQLASPGALMEHPRKPPVRLVKTLSQPE
jgi:hypothetical protein